MKKRIIMLALVVGVMLSVCGSAWADDTPTLDYYFKLTDKTYKGVIKSGDNNVVQFQVIVDVQVISADGDTAPTGYSKNANLLKWTTQNGETPEDVTATEITIYRTGELVGTYNATDNADFMSNPYYLINISREWKRNSSATIAFDVNVSAAEVNNPVAITVSLYNKTDASTPVASTEIASATHEDSTATVDTDNPSSGDSLDSRDPDSFRWDGLDPKFSNTINKTSYDIGKVKPKLVSPAKTDLTLTPGTPKDLTIKMKGPIETLDVYIAQKDAKKLYPASADSITADIRLTSASIKAYKIPFRVTSYDFATSVSATGDTADKLKKAQAKAWKDAENTLTLSFNGSKMQYKGFPITIAMSNSNTNSKPVAKAIKLNIGSDFTTPAWTYSVTSNEKTTDAAKYTAWLTDEDNECGIEYTDEYEATSETALTTEQITAAELDATDLSDGAVATGSDGNKYIYTDGKFYPAALKVDYYYRYFTYNKVITKSDKLEASTWVNNSAAGTAEDPKAGTIGDKDPDDDVVEGVIFTASGDAPYTITVKPDPAKDSAKITKFFASGYSVDIHQPVYDYLGNVKTHGYVRLAGKPTDTTKESKLAFTFTATNPSTKKKGAAKVTANAKTFPEIQKTATATITAAEQDEWDGAVDIYYYSNTGNIDDNNITYKRITTKRVEAGKVPSVKVKAKGSKTIGYKLGIYTVDDGEPVADDEYEDFNAAMLTNLKAKGLSFDEKKGAVILTDKSKKDTKPTLNADEDAFQSLDIVVTAWNNVGADYAWAHVGITGAKPKVADKEVTVTGTVKKGDTFKFKVNAGKVGAETLTDGSANVKALPGDGAASALSGLGLALVPYDSMDIIVSAEVSVTAGSILPASFKSADVVSGHSRSASTADGSTEVAGRRYAADDMRIKSGDTWGKGANDSLKNYGIIQVVKPADVYSKSNDKTANKGVSVNLILENLGSTNKGKIKVIIKNDVKNGGDPLVPVVTTTTTTTTEESSSISNSAAPKTNGTAGYAPNNGALPEDADAENAEAVVTVGAPRTAADLTAGQQAFLAAKGLKVIAVLPEISANVDGQQEFAVELDEDAPEGAKMVYVPFPQNAEATEDDEIADFYGADGEAIEEVPAEKAITVAPWLRAEVTYQPVIAVEAE